MRNAFLLWLLFSLYDIMPMASATQMITLPTIPTKPIFIAWSKFSASSPFKTTVIPKEKIKTATMS